MQKIIVSKNENDITKNIINKEITSKPYMTKNEQCLTKQIKYKNIDNATKEQITITKECINSILIELLNKNDEIIFNKLINMLKNAKNDEDLMLFLNCILTNYTNILKEANTRKYIETNKQLINHNKIIVNKILTENKDLLFSIIIKKFLITYYKYKLSQKSKETIKLLYKSKINNNEIIFSLINEQFNENSRKNGIYELSKKILNDTIVNYYLNMQNHLCWLDCKNASPLKCQKIYDIEKKAIDKYKFIKEGYQIINNNYLDKFVVTKCDNYKKEKKM